MIPLGVLASARVAAANTFFTDFSGYATGSPPAGWTHRWATTNMTTTVEADAGATGGKVLRIARTTTARSFLSWDTIAAGTTDVEIVTRYRPQSMTSSGVSVHPVRIRSSGAAGSEGGYFGIRSQLVGLYKYVAGASTALGQIDPSAADANWHWMRLRANGTTISLRYWPDSSSEPGAWDFSYTDTSHASGLVGLGVMTGQTFDFDVVGVAIGGGSAPKS